MGTEKYISAFTRTVEYFESHLSADGELVGEDVSVDPAFYYKLPSLLHLGGKKAQAEAVLSYIEVSFPKY